MSGASWWLSAPLKKPGGESRTSRAAGGVREHETGEHPPLKRLRGPNQATQRPALLAAQSVACRKNAGRAGHATHLPSSAAAPQRLSKIWAHGVRGRGEGATVSAVIAQAGLES
ncbi:hypothetical protein NDU88_010938 [Pleurodeles waltl]|uniref:Uncharacterized protein n=1 Tax=Pleurodeles waltl TaxID=8319 RepID=A0AAV7QZT7_PLEWA|nr:hypothetical protein NDU88_010938 [Pleurodeles waltl]